MRNPPEARSTASAGKNQRRLWRSLESWLILYYAS
jgi:hypothetical protein